MKIILIFLLTVFLRIYAFRIPIVDVDESIFGTFASVMLHGGIPYIDAIDNKPPLIYFLYYLVWFLFGEHNMVAMRLVTCIFIAATAWVLGKIVSRISGSSAGYVAMLMYVLATTFGDQKYLASSVNIFMALPVSLCVYFFLVALDADRWWKWFMSGLMAGLAMLFRLQGGVMFAVVLACLALSDLQVRSKLRGAWVFIAGGVSVILPVCLLFLGLHAFDDFLRWSIYYGFEYASRGEGAAFWSRFIMSTGAFFINALPLIVPVLYLLYRKFRERQGWNKVLIFLLLWLALSLCALSIGGRFYAHYFLQILPPLCVMSAWGYSLIDSRSFKNAVKVAFVAWAVVFFMIRIEPLKLAKHFHMMGSDWREVTDGECDAGNYVRNKTGEDQRFFVWGFAAPIYFCADRLPASRFIIADPLVGRASGNAREKTDDQDYWNMFFEDIEKNKPAFIVDVSSAPFGAFKRYRIENYPIYGWMVKNGYVFDRTIKKIRIFKAPFIEN